MPCTNADYGNCVARASELIQRGARVQLCANDAGRDQSSSISTMRILILTTFHGVA